MLCHASTNHSSAWLSMSFSVKWTHIKQWRKCCCLTTSLLTAKNSFVADCLDPQMAKQLEEEIFHFRSHTSDDTKATYHTHHNTWDTHRCQDNLHSFICASIPSVGFICLVSCFWTAMFVLISIQSFLLELLCCIVSISVLITVERVFFFFIVFYFISWAYSILTSCNCARNRDFSLRELFWLDLCTGDYDHLNVEHTSMLLQNFRSLQHYSNQPL